MESEAAQKLLRLLDTGGLSLNAVEAPVHLIDEASCFTQTLQIAIPGALAGVLLLIPGGEIVDLILVAATAAAVTLKRDRLQNLTATMNISMFLRSRISPEKIATPALREKLRENIRGQLQKDTNLWQDMTTAVEKSISEHVRDMARRTEISIILEEDEPHVSRA